MSDFLFELGIEEVPVSEIKNIMDQLKSKFISKLKEIPVEFKSIETASTNRRFMIYFSNIKEKADDTEEQVKGPSRAIAYDKDNQPTIALKKFIEANKIKQEDLFEIKTPKGLYIAFERKTEGEKTKDILSVMIPAILKEITFNKTMVWNSSRVPFVRPIKNLLALIDGQIIEFEFAGIKASNLTRGHSLLSENFIKVHSFKDYCEVLYKNFVIISEDERKKKIVDEIVEVEEEFNVHVRPDTKMLEDYIYNNEYPVLFSGQFDKEYLELPSEIISTFMINEKKLLPVLNKENKLINMFIGISNIPDENKHVVRGNERVIKATFEDAKFFWDNDRNDDFFALKDSLKNVMFHQGLGNFYEKTDRLNTLIEQLVKDTGNNELLEPLKEAAKICKNDLVTRMVREFPSLQGIMGGLYIKETGKQKEIWDAVYWHYEPKGFSDKKMESLGGALLSLADKIDNICGFLYKGIKLSSSKDPYGIRRDAAAIIKTLKDFKLDFDLFKIIEIGIKQFQDNYPESSDLSYNEIQKKTQHLFTSRIENVFKEYLHVRYDIVNSVMNRKEELPIYRIYLRAREISKILSTDNLKHLISLHKRLKNIIKDCDKCEVTAENLVEKEEKLLFEIFNQTKDRIESMIEKKEYTNACSEILEMKPVIDNFFEKVMVMAKEKELKDNRIALLQNLDKILSKIADFSLIVE